MKGGARRGTSFNVGAAVAAVALAMVVFIHDDAAKSAPDFIVRFWVPGSLLALVGGIYLLYRLIVHK